MCRPGEGGRPGTCLPHTGEHRPYLTTQHISWENVKFSQYLNLIRRVGTAWLIFLAPSQHSSQTSPRWISAAPSSQGRSIWGIEHFYASSTENRMMMKIAFSLLDFMIQQMYFKLSLAGLVFVIFSWSWVFPPAITKSLKKVKLTGKWLPAI